MHQGTTLLTWEHSRVELLVQLKVIGQDETGTRTAKGLVHRGGNHVRVRHRRRVQASSNQASKVGHINPQVRTNLICDGAELRKILMPRVGGPAGDDHLRLHLARLLAQLGHINQVGVFLHLVGRNVVETAREVDLHAVGQVATVSQRKTQDCVTRLRQRHQHGGVGLCTGVRLHVGVLRAKDFLCTVTCQILHHVSMLAAAVVATPRVPLGVLVSKHRTLCLQHAARHKVLRSNHFQRGALAGKLAFNGGVHLRVIRC